MIVALVPLLFLTAQAPPVSAPEPRPAPSGPVVVLETSLGTIRIVLNPEKAPLSVDNFLKYVRARHYDGTIFHRVMPGFMAQGGGFTPDMKEKPTRPPVKNEAKNGLRNSRGTVAMARKDDPNSATSQFFINVRDNHRLDFGIGGAGYAVFGEVVEGMDVVDKIVAVATTTKTVDRGLPTQMSLENVPVTPVLITTAREGAPLPAAPAPPRPASLPAPGGKP
jgi:peptidyl-prolyl cis-trans isomerase A (cyclophilin A)